VCNLGWKGLIGDTVALFTLSSFSEFSKGVWPPFEARPKTELNFRDRESWPDALNNFNYCEQIIAICGLCHVMFTWVLNRGIICCWGRFIKIVTTVAAYLRLWPHSQYKLAWFKNSFWYSTNHCPISSNSTAVVIFGPIFVKVSL